MTNSIVLFFVFPLLGAFFCLLEKFLPKLHLAKISSLASIIACCVLLAFFFPIVQSSGQLLYTVGGWDSGAGIQQWFDSLSWMSFALVFFLAFLTLLFAIAEDLYDYNFYFVFMVMLAGTAGVLLAADVFNLFVCLEILGIASYILIAYLPKGHAVMASFQYLMLSSLGMAFFLLGVLILYQQTGTLSLLEIASILKASPSIPPSALVAVAALIVGLGVRTAFFRFHTWLPEAHAYAPHPVSAMLSGIHLKISFLTIWRIVLLFDMKGWQTLFLWIGAATALLAVFWALMQSDCKKLLAWHSISQMGYILAGFGAGQTLGLTASFAHIINHGVFKSLLFLSVGSVVHATGERNLKRLGNLAGKLPLLALLFLVGAFSIAGIPPFNGFVSKKLLLAGVKSSPVVYAALWLAGVGTVASFIKLSGIFRKRVSHSVDASAQVTVNKLSPWLYPPMIVLALFCLLTGLFGNHASEFLARFVFGNTRGVALPLYSIKYFLDTLVTLGCGVLLYKSVLSRKGRQLAAYMTRRHTGLDKALMWQVIGFIAFALFILWAERR